MQRTTDTLFLHSAKKHRNSIKKSLLNRAFRNNYHDCRCILTVMIRDMMPQTICCKEINGFKAFPRFAHKANDRLNTKLIAL